MSRLVAAILLFTALPAFTPMWAQDSSNFLGGDNVTGQSHERWSRYAAVVARLYRPEFGPPLWLRGSSLSAPGRAAIDALLRAEEHGLNPRDYDALTLDSLSRGLTQRPSSAAERDRLDALLSVDFIQYLDDLQFGRLHPASLDRSGADTGIDLVAAIRGAIDGDSIPRLVAATAPQQAQYRNLQRLLIHYRQLAADSS